MLALRVKVLDYKLDYKSPAQTIIPIPNIEMLDSPYLGTLKTLRNGLERRKTGQCRDPRRLGLADRRKEERQPQQLLAAAARQCNMCIYKYVYTYVCV